MTIIDPNKKIDKDILIKQYELMVQTTETIFKNRILYNSFFITLITFVLGFISTSIISLLEKKLYYHTIFSIILFIAFIIIFINFWIRVLKQFNLINTEKFNIIEEIEEHFDSLLFKKEYLNRKNKKINIDLSKLDIQIAKSLLVFLIIISSIIILFSLYNIIINSCYIQT
jgi:hypothetical protein